MRRSGISVSRASLCLWVHLPPARFVETHAFIAGPLLIIVSLYLFGVTIEIHNLFSGGIVRRELRLAKSLASAGFCSEALRLLFEAVLRPRLGGRVWLVDDDELFLATGDPLRALEVIAEACPELHEKLAVPVRVGDAYLLGVSS